MSKGERVRQYSERTREEHLKAGSCRSVEGTSICGEEAHQAPHVKKPRQEVEGGLSEGGGRLKG